jgi:ABC-type cobalt transport system, permease component
MGTALMANSTVKLSFAWNAVFFWGVWGVCIIGVGIVLWAALKSPRWARWTTQDILIVAALGVLLEVYDNIIGDQFIKPLINPIPGADLLQLHDLPYMFLLMVGVALVRKPGCVTAMVFINYLLMQLLFGSGHGALDWTDGLTQGIFCDLYIVARRGRVYAPGSRVQTMFIDGLMIGILRAAPNSFLTDWTFDPYLNSIYYTWYQMWTDTWSNALGNGIEAAISASLALRVARSVVPTIGARGAAKTRDVDPFADPAPALAGAGAGGGAAAVLAGLSSPGAASVPAAGAVPAQRPADDGHGSSGQHGAGTSESPPGQAAGSDALPGAGDPS